MHRSSESSNIFADLTQLFGLLQARRCKAEDCRNYTLQSPRSESVGSTVAVLFLPYSLFSSSFPEFIDLAFSFKTSSRKY